MFAGGIQQASQPKSLLDPNNGEWTSEGTTGATVHTIPVEVSALSDVLGTSADDAYPSGISVVARTTSALSKTSPSVSLVASSPDGGLPVEQVTVTAERPPSFWERLEHYGQEALDGLEELVGIKSAEAATTSVASLPHNTFSQRAAAYRQMQNGVAARKIDTVWFKVAADLNAGFANDEQMMVGTRDFLNDLGKDLYAHNAKTYDDVMSGKIIGAGETLDDFLVNREQGFVQDYINRTKPSVFTKDMVDFLFRAGPRTDFVVPGTMPKAIGVGISKFPADHNFNFWTQSDRVTLGDSMMAYYRTKH